MATTQAVAAIIATRNGQSRGFLSEAIASILAQTLRPAEILVIDDASTDGTADRVAERFGAGVCVVRLPANLGPSGARNHGIRLARAPFVAFLDDDDAWLPHKVERQLDYVKRTGAQLVCGRAEVIDSAGKPLPDRWTTHPESLLWPGVLFRNPVQGPGSVLVRRETVLAVGGFPERFRIGEDWLLWAKIARQTALHYRDEVVTRYRLHDHQAAAGQTLTWIHEQTLATLRELVSDLPPAQATLVLNTYAYGGALHALSARRFDEAVRLATAADGRVDWKLMIHRTAVGVVGKVSRRIQVTANGLELRRLVRRFHQLSPERAPNRGV
jgi:glycosyltransferase involved in cell wall biosynthesis